MNDLPVFTEAVEREQKAPALLFEDLSLSYEETIALGSGTARWLRQRLSTEERVLGVLAKNPRLIVRMQLGCLCAGIALYPIDVTSSSQRIVELCQQAGCRRLVTDLDNPPTVVPVNVIRTKVLPGGLQVAPERFAENVNGIGLIVATSGTAGEPKGVMLSFRNLAASASASRRRLGLSPGDLWLNCLPLHHIGGLSILYRCLEAGAAMLLHNRFRADRVWNDLKRRSVTHLSLVPAMFSQLLDQARGASPPDTLKVVLIGGDALDPELAGSARRGGWPICVTYGMTETGSQLATFCGYSTEHRAGYVGEPLDGFRLDSGAGRGRIRVRGEAVMTGYANPGLEPGDGLDDGWFETGDIGELDAKGGLTLLGRADDRLVSGGKTLHPLEIERRLMEFPGVAEAAVVGKPDPVWGDLLVAFYTGSGMPEEVERWSRMVLAGSMRPRQFIHLESLPRNSMGKLDRRALRPSVAFDDAT